MFGSFTALVKRIIGVMDSGRKNVLRKLLRIPYRRLKAGFFLCVDCVCLLLEF